MDYLSLPTLVLIGLLMPFSSQNTVRHTDATESPTNAGGYRLAQVITSSNMINGHPGNVNESRDHHKVHYNYDDCRSLRL